MHQPIPAETSVYPKISRTKYVHTYNLETAREQTDRTLVAATKYSTIGKEGAINPKSLDTPIQLEFWVLINVTTLIRSLYWWVELGVPFYIIMYVCVFYFFCWREHCQHSPIATVPHHTDLRILWHWASPIFGMHWLHPSRVTWLLHTQNTYYIHTQNTYYIITHTYFISSQTSPTQIRRIITRPSVSCYSEIFPAKNTFADQYPAVKQSACMDQCLWTW